MEFQNTEYFGFQIIYVRNLNTMSEKKIISSGPLNGALIAHGGGIDSDNIFKKIFLRLAGGPESNLVYIPSAFNDEDHEGQWRNHLDPSFAANRLGFSRATILHTRNPEEADYVSFVEPITEARAVFITGGRQWLLVDSYLNTRTHRELKNLLKRGGVIAGSSAGATIQGSYLVRGNALPDRNTIMIGDHQEGFGFVANVAIDQHLLEKNRHFDMIEVINKNPDLLGVGIDSKTSVIFKGNQMTVAGNSYVAIYDKRFLSEKKDFTFYGMAAVMIWRNERLNSCRLKRNKFI
jgi:cyanophycinase